MRTSIAATLVCVACVLALAQTPPAAQKPAAPKDGLSVVALTVAQPAPKDEKGFSSSAAPGVQKGTGIHLCLKQSGAFLLGLDTGATRVSALKDDKGKSLPVDNRLHFAQVSDDGHALTCQVSSEELPTPGSKELSLTGKLVATVGSDEKTASQDNVDLKKDTKVSAGPLDGKISQVEPVSFGDEKRLSVDFSNSKGFTGIKSVTFTGPDGKVIESRRSGFSSMSGFGMGSYSISYSLKGAPEKVNIKVVYFAKTEKKEFPIDMKVTLGL